METQYKSLNKKLKKNSLTSRILTEIKLLLLILKIENICFITTRPENCKGERDLIDWPN